MKKRIFIAIHYMEIGGGEMSLIGLSTLLIILVMMWIYLFIRIKVN